MADSHTTTEYLIFSNIPFRYVDPLFCLAASEPSDRLPGLFTWGA